MRARGVAWAARVLGVLGVLVLLVAMPLAARGRLPERLATHWGGGSGAPDGSMPFWGAVAFPAAVWVVLAVVAVLVRRGVRAVLLGGGVLLAGAQAAVVRANLDRTDWRQAGSVTWWVMAVLAAAVLAGLAGALADRRDPAAAAAGAAAASAAAAGTVPAAPGMEIPAGERLVWLSRTVNPWIRLTAAVTGIAAVAAVLAGIGGLSGSAWTVAAPLVFASVALLACSSVRARVSEAGLEVAFGPLGWPVRRWSAKDIEAARAEDRTPAQAGGWGYRVNGLGTTVMLRGGPCLVVTAKGKDFAVSVDDAERGAALLNSLTARRPGVKGER